jgi:hypothetical protein
VSLTPTESVLLKTFHQNLGQEALEPSDQFYVDLLADRYQGAFGEDVVSQMARDVGWSETGSVNFFSGFLDNLGGIHQAAGRWDDAATAYQESLDISRRLATTITTPEAQRDAAVPLAAILGLIRWLTARRRSSTMRAPFVGYEIGQAEVPRSTP